MSATNVGTITYTVDVDTGKLLSTSKSTDSVLDKLAGTFKKTDAAAKGADTQLTKTAAAARQLATSAQSVVSPMESVNRLLGAYITLQGAQKVTSLADAYTGLQNRLRLVTKGQEELASATSDVFSIAQNTSQQVGVVAQVYQRFAQNAETLGINLGQVAEVTDTVAKAVAISGASSASAEAALVQFGQALASGTLRGEELNSVMEQTPALAKAIADGMGITIGQLRAIAAEGEITSAKLIEALSKAADGVNEQFNTRVKTISQAFTELGNAAMRFVGEANNASGASKVLVEALGALTANLDSVVSVLMIAGAGALAKYVAGQGLAIAASVRAALAARAQAAAELEAATAHAAAAAAAAANASAQAGLTVSTTANTAAANANAAAQLRLAAAQKAAQVAGAGLMGILGGPLGIIALLGSAAAAVVMFGNNTANAVPQVDSLTNSVDKLSKAQLALRKQQAEEGIDKLKQRAIEAGSAVKGLEKDFTDLEAKFKSGKGGVTQQGLDNVKKTLTEARAESDAAIKSLQEMINASAKLSEEQKKREGGTVIKPTAGPQKDPEVEKRLKGMREEAELAKLTGEARARLAAIQKLGSKATKEEREEAEKLATQIYRLEESRKAEAAALKDGESAAKKSAAEKKREAEKLQKEHEKDTETLKNLAQEIALANLQGRELAMTQAMLKLGEYATPEQIAAALELGGILYDVNKQKEMLSVVGNDPLGYVRGDDAKPLSGGAFDDQAARYDAEAEAENKRYQGQLDRLSIALEAQKLTLQEGFDEQESLYAEHAARMEQIENAKQSTIYAAAEKGLGAATDGLKAAFGEQNALYKVAFAAQKAFAIAQSIIAIQQGIALAAANPWPLNIGAMASVAAATASIISNISSVAMGGGKQYGGAVDPSKMYRINETGAPEVFNAANGQQYMLPNTRGEVVSNKNASGNGAAAVSVVVNLIESQDRAGTTTQSDDGNGGFTIDAFVADIYGEGKGARAMQDVYGITRQGR